MAVSRRETTRTTARPTRRKTTPKTVIAIRTGWGYVTHWVPILGWLPRYRPGLFRADVIAALALWGLVVPQAVAYAGIAGLPPVAGLFAAFAGLLAYGVLGTSKQLIVNPTSSTAAISASMLAPLAGGNAVDFAALSAILAIMMGISLIALGLLKMGFVSRFIAEPVTVGFMFGLGLTIIVSQVPALLGISGGSEEDFFPRVETIYQNIGDTNAWTAFLGIGGIVALLVLRRGIPAAPGPLFVVAGAIAFVVVLDLKAEGVAVLGSIDGEKPTLAWPTIDLDVVRTLLPGALALAIIGYAESTTVAESMAEEHQYRVRPDQELLAIGGANIAAGAFQGFIVGGGASQTAANDKAGARTQMTGLIVAGLVFATAIWLLPLFADLPEAVLAAIVITAVLGFLNLPALRKLARLTRTGLLVALFAMAAVLILGVLPGLVLAIAASILTLLVRMSRPPASQLGQEADTGRLVAIDHDLGAVVPPGVFIFRMNAPLVFLNAKKMLDDTLSYVDSGGREIRVVIVDLAYSPTLDPTTIDTIASLERELTRRGMELWLANVRAKVPEMLRKSGIDETLGGYNVYRNIDDAVPAIIRIGEELAEQRRKH